MGLDDVLKQQLRQRLPDLKAPLVEEFDELTHRDVDEAGDDPRRQDPADGSAARPCRGTVKQVVNQ